ncbi:hypothetical protein [Burkholderia cenocepacia]|uniref:hypothetical protein n=1 Tax=Burkholderia cenocepacia TaxID=95486 RepID=UPI0009813E1F|nr:hypothetical protein [Burkholderia cenocepacia]MBR8250255.1 hypothetical protein [Burkholderia cenocepacia]MBR8286566.1 hypothetical protein [Burkholderia cenocepacia]MBR8500443.1 hypothetical protein [Burkholderia cenocepacia]ONP21287.1 hypothetical protein A8D84_29295 [Burkholderia cenocepacia]ONT16726.1 hypothetical protein A8E40_27825 [Burkholderia cenocepacia]
MATSPGLAALDLLQEAFDRPSTPHLGGREMRGDWLQRACVIRRVVSVHVSSAGLRDRCRRFVEDLHRVHFKISILIVEA